MRLKINFYKGIYKVFLSPKSNLIKHPDPATNLQEEHGSGGTYKRMSLDAIGKTQTMEALQGK